MNNSILTRAEELIHGERVKLYGKASDSFAEIALMASVATGKGLNAEDISKIMVCAKLIRDKYSPENIDHITDAAGYLGIIEDIRKG